jgi:hypothetical protein
MAAKIQVGTLEFGFLNMIGVMSQDNYIARSMAG